MFVCSLLEHAGLSRLPHAFLVVVGARTELEVVLLHHALRNTIHTFYLAIHDIYGAKKAHASPNLKPHTTDFIHT